MDKKQQLYAVPFSRINHSSYDEERFFLIREPRRSLNENSITDDIKDPEHITYLTPYKVGDELVGIVVLNHKQEHFLQQVYENRIDLVHDLDQYAATPLHPEDLNGNMEMKYIKSVFNLAKNIDGIDPFTCSHRLRTATFADRIAKKMGFSENDLHDFRVAGLLHDVGKFAVPADIIRKPSRLSDTEWEIMKRHPQLSADILAPVDRFSPVVPIVKAHHEKYNGSGYPYGLQGDQIPLGARILALADAYSSMVDGRVYREALSSTDARKEIERCSGSHFDPQVVKAALAII